MGAATAPFFLGRRGGRVRTCVGARGAVELPKAGPTGPGRRRPRRPATAALIHRRREVVAAPAFGSDQVTIPTSNWGREVARLPSYKCLTELTETANLESLDNDLTTESSFLNARKESLT